MTTFDLLDIYEILIHIRFSLDSKESLQLVTLLVDALYTYLGNMLNNEVVQEKFVRNYFLTQCKINIVPLGTFDSLNLATNNFVSDQGAVFAFLVIMCALKKYLTQGEYGKAFSLVDGIHNYPLDLIAQKKYAKKQLVKTTQRLLAQGDG